MTFPCWQRLKNGDLVQVVGEADNEHVLLSGYRGVKTFVVAKSELAVLTEPITWKLVGYDTFEGGPDAFYELGTFDSVAGVRAAAQARLAELNRTQPGAGSIQDRVYIIHPDGRQEFVRQR